MRRLSIPPTPFRSSFPPIMEFSGTNRFLSNFYPCRVRFEGKEYSTVEHAYQAAKTLDKHQREAIRCAATPGAAKRLGRQVQLRSDWGSVKISVMKQLLREKMRGSNLGAWLVNTYPHELVEGNNWGDRFWGRVNGEGENWLGRLLMEVRVELLEEALLP